MVQAENAVSRLTRPVSESDLIGILPMSAEEWSIMMNIIQGTTDIRFDFPTAVALGKFDGLHRGHQKLIRELRDGANSRQKIVAFTFDIPPAAVLDKVSAPVLTTREEKRRLMEAMGVDILIEYPFTEETSRMEAESFVRELLVGRLCMKTLAVGPDCGFGYQRKGDVELLERLSDELQFSLQVVEKERTRKDDLVVSSSRVKAELRKGDIEEVNRLLGYLYSVNGHALSADGTQVSASLERTGESWLIAQGDDQYKLTLQNGRYFSRVWFDDWDVKSVTEIKQISETQGELLTVLKEPVPEKYRGFTPEISLIAQFKD